MRKSFITAVIILLIGISANGQNALKTARPEDNGMDAARLSQVDRVFEEAIAEKAIPGAVISVVRGDRIVYLKAFGNKSIVPKAEPMTTETMFDLASVSKCVSTTLSFMQLIESGKVRLTDRVDMYIPGFKPWEDPDTGEKVDIIIRDLMTHSSGLDAYAGVDAYVAEFGEKTPEQFEQYIATRAGRHFRPGTDCLYSCLNFITLQRILERVTGQRLCDYASEHVFKPLGLSHTCYFPVGESFDKGLKKLCAPTEVQSDGLPLIGAVHDPIARRIMGGNSGNAGVFSDARDLSVICAAIMNHGILPSDEDKPGKRILAPMTVDLMCRAPMQNDPKVGRALGWDKDGMNPGTRGDIFNPEDCIWHTGYTGPSVLIDMDNKTAVIILANRVHPEDKGSLARLRAQVANIVAGAIVD